MLGAYVCVQVVHVNRMRVPQCHGAVGEGHMEDTFALHSTRTDMMHTFNPHTHNTHTHIDGIHGMHGCLDAHACICIRMGT